MKAITIREFGSIDVLRLEDAPLGEPGAGEVCIRVEACALNHLDIDVRSGVSRFPVTLPFVPGFEVVGEIIRTGSEVEDWTTGDRVAPKVMATCRKCRYCQVGRESLCDYPKWISFAYSGGYAEALICSADQLIRVPETLSAEGASALQVAFATAWHMLFTRGRLQAGETVLINSVGSGIGAAAVQLAKWAGAYAIGTARDDDKLNKAKKLGLDRGISYGSGYANVSRAALEATDGVGVDLVFEHVGGELLLESLAAVRKGGRVVTCGAHSKEVVPFDVIPFFRAEKQLIGSYVFSTLEILKVFELAQRGVVRPVVDSVYPLEEVQRATRRMESRRAFGKIILKPTPGPLSESQ